MSRVSSVPLLALVSNTAVRILNRNTSVQARPDCMACTRNYKSRSMCSSMHWVRSLYSRARRPRPPRSFFLCDQDTNTMAVSSLAIFMRLKVCLLFDFTVKSNYADVKAETIICIDLLRTTVRWCGECCILCYCILLHLLSIYKNFIIMLYPYESLYLVHWCMVRHAAHNLTSSCTSSCTLVRPAALLLHHVLHLVLHLVHLYDLLHSYFIMYFILYFILYTCTTC